MILRSPSLMMVLVASHLLLSGCSSTTRPTITSSHSAGGLAFDLIGEGPLVVLIHGSNLDRRMWDEEVTWMQKRSRVLRYDLRGQGESDDPSEPYSNHRDLLALLDELGETQVSLIGLSSGAQVAVDVALEAPQRVRRMVLASPSLSGYMPHEMPPFFADLGTALRAKDYQRANEILLASPILAVPPKFVDRVRTMVVDNSRLWTIPYSLVEQLSPPAIDRLESIEAPILVLVGEDDLEAIRAQGLLLEERCPEAKRVVIAHGGHLLNMTSPDAFRQAVSDFFGW